MVAEEMTKQNHTNNEKYKKKQTNPCLPSCVRSFVRAFVRSFVHFDAIPQQSDDVLATCHKFRQALVA